MVAKKETKGGSPAAIAAIENKQKLLDEFGITGVTPNEVYIIDRNDEAPPLVIRKPIGRDLGRAHLELLLEINSDEPLKEYDAVAKVERTLPSPRAKETRKAVINNWIENLLPKMLVYPAIDDLTYGDEFILFQTVFAEIEHANSSFRLLR